MFPQPLPGCPSGPKHLTGDVGRPLPASPLLRALLHPRYLCDAQVPTCATHLTGDAGRPLPASPLFFCSGISRYLQADLIIAEASTCPASS